jgi:restriction endonuclease S subunit
MLVALGKVASVRTATIFRERAPEQSSDGNVHALTIKDVVTRWPINSNTLPLIKIDQKMLDNCLVGGEVLIPSRGDYYPARYFHSSAGHIFPYGQINVITPGDRVLGRYLAWYLNQPASQQFIDTSLTGTSIKALNKPRLLEIPIQVPPIDTQNAIVDLQELLEKSKALKERLIALEAQEIEWTCRKLLLTSNN